jgi:hypothetical protein
MEKKENNIYQMLLSEATHSVLKLLIGLLKAAFTD